MASVFQFPRPRTFLHIVSLPTATEFITLILAINKVTGLYGILALFTGYTLNPLQLSHYVYSLAILGLVAWLSPAIREPATEKASVLKNVALAWVYVLDTIINSFYTVLFSLGWFVLLAQHLNEPVPIGGDQVPGKQTMDDTAGFTSPEVNATSVEVVAAPGPGAFPGQEAVAFPSGSHGTLGSAVFQSGSIASLTVLGLLWIVRVYFCIIVLSHARTVVRRYIASTSNTAYVSTLDPTIAENPFRADHEAGMGWHGKLGRSMLKLPTQRYWLGKDESEEEWLRATSGRFDSGVGHLRIKVPENGVSERERRARSGTGPPAPLKGKIPQ